MKTIKDIDLKNKKVVIRDGYNVPVENGIIKDSSKIKKSLRSIRKNTLLFSSGKTESFTMLLS